MVKWTVGHGFSIDVIVGFGRRDDDAAATDQRPGVSTIWEHMAIPDDLIAAPEKIFVYFDSDFWRYVKEHDWPFLFGEYRF